MIKIKLLLVVLFTTFYYSQGLVREPNINDLLRTEYKSIKDADILEELFYAPYIEKTNSKTYFNILSKLDYGNYFIIEPVAALRYSSIGFGMYAGSDDLSASPVVWITPGLKMHSTIPILKGFSNYWIYSWVDFYKHSAYGFGGNQTEIDTEYPLFNFNSNYSVNFYTMTQSPNNGIDFDEGQSGISLLSQNFQIIFGKYKTNIGPFASGNLSISNNAPSFPQLMIKYNHKNKLLFSYLIGSLNSNIPHNYCQDIDANCYVNRQDLYVDEWELQNSAYWYNEYYEQNIYPPSGKSIYERYVVNHRIDFKPINNFRIGFYEQIIFGAKSPPFNYLIPINPLWSSQHSGNDTDNLLIGLDFDFIFNKYRLYGSLIIDEWALFDTFSNDERNWFAHQIGLSRILSIYNKKALFKAEYSKVDPRAYRHRYIINQPKHNGYNLGFWSGSDSDNLYTNLSIFINDQSIIKFNYQYTRIGNQNDLVKLENQYNNINVDFLDGDIDIVKNIGILYSTSLRYSIMFDLEFNNISTNIFSNSLTDYTEIKVNFRYNINY